MSTTPNTWMDAWKRERRAGTPIIALATPDVPAATAALVGVCGGTKADTAKARLGLAGGSPSSPCVVWTCSSGLRPGNPKDDDSTEAVAAMCEALGGCNPEAVSVLSDALVAARKLPERSVLVIVNGHLGWEQAMSRDAAQLLRDPFKTSGRTLTILAPDVGTIPRELAGDVRILREELPAHDARSTVIRETYNSAGVASPANKTGLPVLTDEVLAEAASATAGLTAFATEQATAVALRAKGIDMGALRATSRETINARKGLRVSDERIGYDAIGGLGALAGYVRALFRGPDKPCAVVLLDEIEKMLAGSSGGDLSGVSSDILGALLTWIERRKVHGVLLMGPPGSGKSLSAQAAAGEHGVPLVWCDVGAMKGSLVGESGANIRAALDTIDAVSEGRVLLVATCNGVAELKPELLRRFKPRFVVDLPDDSAQAAIWKIQLAAHGLPADAELPAEAAGWTGAEIRDACQIARATGSTPREAAGYIVPIAVSAADVISRVRREAVGRFIDASRGGPYRGPARSPAAPAPANPQAIRRPIIAVGEDDGGVGLARVISPRYRAGADRVPPAAPEDDMTTSTTSTITNATIRMLRAEAVQARDYTTAALCDRAGDLGGGWCDLLTPAEAARIEAMLRDDARDLLAAMIARAAGREG